MTRTLTTPRGAVLEIELTKLDDMRLFDALVGGGTLRQGAEALVLQGERKNAVKAALPA